MTSGVGLEIRQQFWLVVPFKSHPNFIQIAVLIICKFILLVSIYSYVMIWISIIYLAFTNPGLYSHQYSGLGPDIHVSSVLAHDTAVRIQSSIDAKDFWLMLICGRPFILNYICYSIVPPNH